MINVIRGIKPEIIEERGEMTRILDTDDSIHSILYITSRAGTTRSNHYHKHDKHYCYILSGKADWYEKPVEGGEIEKVTLQAGDMVETPPMTIHTVKFLEDTVFLTFSTQPRNQEHYEDDTVRVKLIE